MTRKKFIPVVLIAVLLFAAYFYFCGRSPKYLTFVNQDQNYYQKIARDCENVLENVPLALSDGHRIPAQDMHLPMAIENLHPDYLRITTNRVFLSIGVGRGSYGIAWQGDNASSGNWELRSYAENLEKVLFVKKADLSSTRQP